ncbi:Fatty acid desaturase [Sphingobacterium multivorum]|uniref:Fatty acid desaturase n=1 Tax=Sphingobacterium multivorum TaxID=28454 RepID=A0A2X2LYJ3_SPHMU|nr:fatty acid desaturase [Sphingobacterium multivorum]SPZ94640.1 Fatty acid desaturase [Sphingobacterium multivorum]
MHDAGHNSFSDNKNLNTVLSYSLNLLGGNIYFWKLKHNIAHHTYTNIDGEDHDIEVKFMRIHHDQKLRKHHRYQRFYFPLLYGISYLAWIFYQDYEKYFRGRMGHKTEQFHFPVKERIIFGVSKLIHFSLFCHPSDHFRRVAAHTYRFADFWYCVWYESGHRIPAGPCGGRNRIQNH